jgi:hypothetical protein
VEDRDADGPAGRDGTLALGGAWRLALPLGLLVMASAASAQRIDESEIRERELRLSQQSPRALIDNGVVQRLRPGYDAEGIAVGGFRAYPKVAVQLAYDTNTLETPIASADEQVTIRPSISVRSNWERHSLNLDAAASIERFGKNKTENADNYDVGLNGVLDFGLGGHVKGLGRIARQVEDRGSIGDLFPGGEIVRYRKQELAGGIEEHLPGLFASLDGDFGRYRYYDVHYRGVTFSQDYRDRDESRVTGQVAFRIAPRMAFFTEASANSVQYRSQPAGSDFSSHGQSVLAGITFQIPAMVSGEIGIGYIRQTYDELPLGPVYGLTYDLSALWNVTPLLTATVGVHRSIQQTPYQAAPSIIETRFEMKLDYELLRNVLVNVQGTLTLDDFGGAYSIDSRRKVSLGVRYLMNRTLSADFLVDWRKQKASSSFLRAYDGASVRVGLTAQR